ncbi:MAG: InlB B-repeat-containing protein, partial [Oscillospiraceae bacterium]
YGNNWGGSGGSGGGRGGSGSSGYVYKAPSATLNGNGNNGSATGHSSVDYATTLDQGSGSGGTTALTATYGVTPANITIPTLAQHEFLGYYTQPNGNGTRYFDHRGFGTSPWTETKDTTLYALWNQSQFNITFNKQGGSGGSDFIVTASNDGTLTPITPPTRAYHVFEGYFSKASGGGEQYYDASGAVVNNKKLAANTTLFAKWRQNQYEIRFDKLGGTGGSGNTYTKAEGVLPKIEMPTRVGYALSGYSSKRFSTSTDDMYYSADGTPAVGKTITKITTLFAQWASQAYNITYQGLAGATISGNPTTRDYLTACAIPQPTKAGYTFLGWQVDDAQARVMDLSIPANTPSYAKNITLTATWTKGASTAVEVGTDISGAVSNPDEIKKQLGDVFKTVVPDATDNMGITARDLDAESIKILLKVDKDINPKNQELINNISKNSVSEFYDITAEKTVTTTAGIQPPVVLKEIPTHLDVKIPLKGELAGLASYVVYRVHDGVPERLSSDSSTGAEYYTLEDVNGTPNIVIRTRKFSTYAIAGSIKSTKPNGEEMANGGSQDVGGFDVQGHVTEQDDTLVYKVDISWGAMKYDFAVSKEWDPETHTYSEGGFNGWRQNGFDGKNNKLSSINHSNGGVIMNYAVVENSLVGVDMALHLYNNIQSEPAHSMQLPAAPIGSLDKELVPYDAYMFLTGAPENSWLTAAANKTFQKVGRILVTVFPQQP